MCIRRSAPSHGLSEERKMESAEKRGAGRGKEPGEGDKPGLP